MKRVAKVFCSFCTDSGFGVRTFHDEKPYIDYGFSADAKPLWEKLIAELRAAGYEEEE